MRIAIFDYGAGNLHSLSKALDQSEAQITIEVNPLRAIEADVLILPGVGAFGAAMEQLAAGQEAMSAAIRSGLPTIGICLGMQLLFDESEEGGGVGLGVIPGKVTRLRAKRVPQIGWNDVGTSSGELVFTAAPLGVAYYANSFVCRPDDDSVVSAWSEYQGDRFPAAVEWSNTIGVQFHPEKSSRDGVAFLQAAVRRVSGARVNR